MEKVWKYTWDFKKIIVSVGALLILALILVLKKSGEDIKSEYLFVTVVGVMAFVTIPIFSIGGIFVKIMCHENGVACKKQNSLTLFVSYPCNAIVTSEHLVYEEMVISKSTMFDKERIVIRNFLGIGPPIKEIEQYINNESAKFCEAQKQGIKKASGNYLFTSDMLKHYAKRHMRDLEKILNQKAVFSEDRKILDDISEKIAKKINYTKPINNSKDFLINFYEAQKEYFGGI